MSTKLKAVADLDAPAQAALPSVPGLGNRFPPLQSLPPEIRKQVRGGYMDGLASAIIRVMDEKFGGVATPTEVWLALWQEDPCYDNRRSIANKMQHLRVRNHKLYGFGDMRATYMTISRARACGGAGGKVTSIQTKAHFDAMLDAIAKVEGC